MEVWTREVCSKDPEEVQDDDCKAMTTPMALNPSLVKAVMTLVQLHQYHSLKEEWDRTKLRLVLPLNQPKVE